MKAFIYRRKSQEDKKRQELSFENQSRIVAQLLERFPDLEIVEDFQESQTAFKAGRPLFNEMLARIRRGEAQVIIAWSPDRLSRNPTDAAAIIEMLDDGSLKDLRFTNYSFENNPIGKMMLQIMLAQSKYFSDALSVNVKLGLETKLLHGWRPGRLAIGYRPDRATKTIVRDEDRFPFIQRMLRMALAGTHSPRDIQRIAQMEWGLTTRLTPGSGGGPLTLSGVYKLLANPFYAGLIIWDGKTYPGKHETMLSFEEFTQLQQQLGKLGKARPQRHVFAFTGVMRCSCGLMVTAEHKINRQGHEYHYYRCTRRRPGTRCPHPAISERELEGQMRTFLGVILIHPVVYRWICEVIRQEESEARRWAEARRVALTRTITTAKAQITELTRLRLRGLLDDEEMAAERERLQQSVFAAEQALQKLADASEWFSPVLDVVWFSVYAVESFSRPEISTKRLVVETAGSHPVLGDKKLNIQAAKPFVYNPMLEPIIRMCGLGEDVLTSAAKSALELSCPIEAESIIRHYIKQVRSALDEPEGRRTAARLRELRELLTPPGEELDEAA